MRRTLIRSGSLLLTLICLAVPGLARADEPNHPPECEPVSFTVKPGHTRAHSYLCTDKDVADNGSLIRTIDSLPEHGTAELDANANIRYTAGTGYEGPDSFVIRTEDGHGGVDLSMVQLTISSANAAPVCPDTSFTVTVGVPDVFLSLRCSDADFDELTYEVTDAPDHGTLLPTQEPGVWEFEPEADYAGPDGFTVRVSDGDTSVVVPVNGTIEARPTPAPPVCPNLSLTTPPGRELRVPLDCLDPLGRHGLPEIVEPPSAATGSLGIISLNPYSVLFTPAPGFVGVTRFTYRSTTPWAVSPPATIEISVRDAPPPGTSGGEAPAPPTQAQAVPAADVAPPALALAIPSRLAAAKSLAFDLTLSEPAALAVKLTVSRATARRLKLARRTLGTATRAAAAGSTRVRVKLGTQARRALTRSKRPVKVKVAAVAIDAAGNRRALSRNVTVRRR